MGYKNPEEHVRYHAQYRAARREKFKLAARQYRKDNPHIEATYRPAYRATRVEREKEVKAKNYLANKSTRNRQTLEAYFRRKYGITIAIKEAMVVAQDSKCAICEESITVRTGHTDHQHVPFKLREILCRYCNPGLGNFRERPELLEKAAAYLRRHFSNPIVED